MAPNASTFDTPNGTHDSVKHFLEYPNDAGFTNVPETRTPIELKVTGCIPSYVHGVLYRTGPGSFSTPTKQGQLFKIQHWFDGFALQHRFEITPDGRVYYRSRRTCDDHIKSIQETGRLPMSFGQKDLCDSFFHKFFAMFKGTAPAKTSSARNIQVTLTPNFPVGPKITDQSHRDKTGLRNLYVKTDVNLLRSLDPVTLEPIELIDYGDIMPEGSGRQAASHAAVDPDTGELFNFVLSPGRVTTYTLFKLTPPTTEEPAGHKVLTTITDAPAAYIHSVCLTKKYFIFCVWQADYALNGALIPYHKNVIQGFKSWNPNRKTLWYVIDRENGGIVRRYESDPFFAFHHINSYDDGDNVVVDLCTYTNYDIFHSFYLDALRSSLATKTLDSVLSHVTRVTLGNVTQSKSVGIAEITKTSVPLELPTISAPYTLRPSKFVYGVSSRGLSSLWDCIYKIDLEALYSNPIKPPEGAVKQFSRPKCTPSEPIFVPRPGAAREDDGVVLMVELDGAEGRSALVIIDGQTFEEIGRAEVEGEEFVVPHHFHGAWCFN